jgi:hypothetical protein
MRQAARIALLACIAVQSGIAPALAEDESWDTTGKYAGVYLCIPEVSGGVFYDEQAKAWRSGSFKPGENRIFRLKDNGARQPIATGSELSAIGYDLTISTPGEQQPLGCYSREGSADNFVLEGRIMCFAFSSIYTLDLRSMRYMHIYTYGYTDGVDATGNTPLVTVGKCSKIE